MPNTLGHFGVQGLLSRLVWRDVDLKWILLGCVVPDVPWIARRAAATLVPGIDHFALRVYAAVQASLAGALLLSLVFALVARTPRRIFALLAANSVLHLGLDAMQEKWGPGILFGAPFSWHETSAGFFWPGGVASYALTILGAAVTAWLLLRARGAPSPLRRPPLLAGMLLAAYLLLPLLAIEPVHAANPHLDGLRNPRAGAPVQLDRIACTVENGEATIHSWARQEFTATGHVPKETSSISLRGTFVDEHTVRIDDLHVHTGPSRDWFNYIGLALLAAVWIRNRRGAGAEG